MKFNLILIACFFFASAYGGVIPYGEQAIQTDSNFFAFLSKYRVNTYKLLFKNYIFVVKSQEAFRFSQM